MQRSDPQGTFDVSVPKVGGGLTTPNLGVSLAKVIFGCVPEPNLFSAQDRSPAKKFRGLARFFAWHREVRAGGELPPGLRFEAPQRRVLCQSGAFEGRRVEILWRPVARESAGGLEPRDNRGCSKTRGLAQSPSRNLETKELLGD